MPRKQLLDFEALRRRIEAGEGSTQWRSLNELAEGEAEDLARQGEFPQQAFERPDGPSRRRFLQLMGASLALAGLEGCGRPPDEKIVPYVDMPEYLVPGKPLYFATAMPMGGYGLGLTVESHMYRPTRIDGNPLHPATLGATDQYAQADILTLYDPDRSQAIKHRQTIHSRPVFIRHLSAALELQAAQGGSGLRVLTERVSSPTLIAQMAELRDQFPQMQWHQYDPVASEGAYAAADELFGRQIDAVYHFDRADVVLSLDADFLSGGNWPISYARHFMQRRLVGDSAATMQMNRLYVAETTPSITGSKADHQRTLSPQQLLELTRAIAQRLGVEVGSGAGQQPSQVPSDWIDAVVDDLQNYRLQGQAGSSLVVPGHYAPAEVHVLAHAINRRLGNVGTTVSYIEPVLAPPTSPASPLASLTELVEAMRAGEVQLLLILGGNPVYSAPADLDFASALQQVSTSVHLGLFEDETSALCGWHLPALHFLESWGDVRAFDGTASIIQPLIAPLYDGWNVHQLLSTMLGQTEQTPYDRVRQYWRQQWGDAGFESRWQEALRAGIIADTQNAPQEVRFRAELQTVPTRLLQDNAGSRAQQAPSSSQTAPQDSPTQSPQADPADEQQADPAAGASNRFEVVFRPDPSIWDGTFANNGWLQELPKPLTKLTWDNAAMISPRAAERLQLKTGQMVRLSHGDRSIELPVWILPGQPEQMVTLHLGYGRRRTGRVGTGAGFDVTPLRTRAHFWHLESVQLTPLEGEYLLVTAQEHYRMEDRDLVEHGTLDQLHQDPEHPPFMHRGHEPEASLYPEWKYDGYKWGMVINLTTCTGCRACVVACQSENNIPIVGKQEVEIGREMHWLRIDTYYSGDLDHPETYHQPLLCMHCEKAPCEVVCPVAATTHSSEGINEMTYNRCVGTRYCSNNCPYKVRRFNYFQYADYDTPVLKLLRNPNVTVRSRGVMEKCTYCIQRINTARIEAEKEDRQIRPGEVVTACQSACPTDAIIFGNLNEPRERVTQLKQLPFNYGLLEDLNTQPRTTYLAALSNPHPALVKDPRPSSHKTGSHGSI